MYSCCVHACCCDGYVAVCKELSGAALQISKAATPRARLLVSKDAKSPLTRVSAKKGAPNGRYCVEGNFLSLLESFAGFAVRALCYVVMQFYCRAILLLDTIVAAGWDFLDSSCMTR